MTTSPRQEDKLIRRLKQRDEEAFRQVVQLYQQKVFHLVYRMLGDRQEAEDISQEVFITVFKSIDSFRGDSKFST
ncbi:MAG: sigma factor, partial [Myxococcota bacterium]